MEGSGVYTGIMIPLVGYWQDPLIAGTENGGVAQSETER